MPTQKKNIAKCMEIKWNSFIWNFSIKKKRWKKCKVNSVFFIDKFQTIYHVFGRFIHIVRCDKEMRINHVCEFAIFCYVHFIFSLHRSQNNTIILYRWRSESLNSWIAVDRSSILREHFCFIFTFLRNIFTFTLFRLHTFISIDENSQEKIYNFSKCNWISKRASFISIWNYTLFVIDKTNWFKPRKELFCLERKWNEKKVAKNDVLFVAAHSIISKR